MDETGREIPITLEEIAESGEHALEDVREALEVVQHFDPPGVAARDLRECLMIQLRVLGEDDSYRCRDRPRSSPQAAKQAIQGNRQGHAACRSKMIMDAVEIVKQLDPRPGQKYNRTQPRLIEPDVFIVKVGGQYTVVDK